MHTVLSTLFTGPRRKRPEQILAIDLGSRTTKAVHLHRRGEGFNLSRFALLDAPIFDKAMSADMLGEHLKAVSQALDAKTRQVSLTTGVNDAIVRHLEVPRMPLDDMRMVLKHNSRNYLQQELSNHVFDCHLLPSPTHETPKAGTPMARQRVLAAGGKQELIDEYTAGAKSAGLVAEHIVPGLVGPVNAFEMAMPDAFLNEVVALIDIGFRSASICLLQQGELILSRVVNLGGDRLTQAVAESLEISYAEAEGIKMGMPQEVQAALESVLLPLGRELRASIDFFEHQQDCPVAAAYLTGGTTRSEFLVQLLQQELAVETHTWNPTGFLKVDLPPQQAAELEHVAPQLAVAIGAGIAAL
ncbi:MAG TPA: pilus assembly protein PilM [Verrucomicrobiota bacterium]|nr:pilus assembly protein PilM [Verrucomicrobiota bacterium]HNT13471.1 pilus assembly protein PilM [Verrucomicrobiota bacterium]